MKHVSVKTFLLIPRPLSRVGTFPTPSMVDTSIHLIHFREWICMYWTSIKSFHSLWLEHNHESISSYDSYSTSFHIHTHYTITCLLFIHNMHDYHIHFREWICFNEIYFMNNFYPKTHYFVLVIIISLI